MRARSLRSAIIRLYSCAFIPPKRANDSPRSPRSSAPLTQDGSPDKLPDKVAGRRRGGRAGRPHASASEPATDDLPSEAQLKELAALAESYVPRGTRTPLITRKIRGYEAEQGELTLVPTLCRMER